MTGQDELLAGCTSILSSGDYQSIKSPCFPLDVKQAETREVATKVLLSGVNNFAVARPPIGRPRPPITCGEP